MPETPPGKKREHPARRGAKGQSGKAAESAETGSFPLALRPFAPLPLPRYAELSVTTNFSFLRGASHPEEMVEEAVRLGHSAAAISDGHTFAGIVRAHVAAKEVGIPLAVGARVDVGRDETQRRRDEVDDTPFPPHPFTPSLLLYATSRDSYGRLSRLLTLGKRRAVKGECRVSLGEVIEHGTGLLAVVLPPSAAGWDVRALDEMGELESRRHASTRVPGEDEFVSALRYLRGVFDDDRLSLAVAREFGADDRGHLRRLAAMGADAGVPLVAVNHAHYHTPERRPLQDALACIRMGCTVEEAGLRLAPHAERHLKNPSDMGALFAGYPRALERTALITGRAAAFSLDELKYQYPEETCPAGSTPLRHLTDLAWQGARERYPRGVPDKVKGLVEHELKLIEELNYAPYFLTVHDLVVFARSKRILCQGRGAAANSAVCYCLGVTSVDPERIDLLFERFVSRERNEPPDIDIDFEHERREEAIQYLYGKYGRERAALCAEVISYRGRSAIRDVGKAMGLSLDCVDRLARTLDWWGEGEPDERTLRELGLNSREPMLRRTIALAAEVQGFPRHLSQHVGGFVITKGPLCEMVPIENAAMPDRTMIEWDKDDIDAMSMLKVDVLGLGMLTCISKAFGLVNARAEYTEAAEDDAEIAGKKKEASDQRDLPHPLSPSAASAPLSATSAYSSAPSKLELHTIPPEDPEVYRMIQRADTIGVFQIESRAQMSMLPRLRPASFYDLVIEVAIVRPGPIQGNMVHPYLRRRNGEEPVTYPHEDVRKVLGKTLGVPLFQEQAMSLAIVAAGFSPGEADQLRRAMAAWTRKGDAIARFERKFIDGMISRHYPRDFAERCFEQVKGFSEYGFPESHAASFALLVYVSSWLKRYHPAAFAASLINSQPMGFYAPAQIARDAREHGVDVRPVDVNRSEWDCTLEEGSATSLRLGMRLVKGLPEAEAKQIAEAVKTHGPFDTIESLWRATRVKVASLRRLARADAFGSMGLTRQQALWQIMGLSDEELPLLEETERPAAAGRLRDGETKRASDVSPSHRITLSPSRDAALPPIPPHRLVTQDYAATGLSLKAHPVVFLRDELNARGITPAASLRDEAAWPHGKAAAVAGIVLVRQRPGTASGIVFMTLEDETGIANLIVRPDVYERYRRAARHSVILGARGRVERQGEVVHVLVRSLESLDALQPGLAAGSRDFH